MRIFLLFMVLISGANLAFAETVQLKTGIILEGEIIEKTDEFLILNTEKSGKYKLRLDQIDDAGTAEGATLAMDSGDEFEKNFHLGMTHFSNNDYKKASQYLEKALLLKPDNADVLMNLTALKFMTGNGEAAIKYLKRILEVNPNDFNANMALGSYLFQNHQNQEALPYFEKCFKIDPMAETSYFLLADVYTSLGETTKALEYLKNGLNVKPNSANIYMHLAALYKNALKDPRGALPYAKKSIELKESPEAYYLLGEIYLELNQSEDATAALQKSKEITKTP